MGRVVHQHQMGQVVRIRGHVGEDGAQAAVVEFGIDIAVGDQERCLAQKIPGGGDAAGGFQGLGFPRPGDGDANAAPSPRQSSICWPRWAWLMTSSVKPAALRRSICQTMRGLPPATSRGLGVWSVRGRMRSPRPAARIMAFGG
jgi:hypothetical protein